MSHDFKRQGARTVAKTRVGRFALWVEESANWHHDRTARYGLQVTTAPSISSGAIYCGRWSLVLAWNLGRGSVTA